MKLNVLKLQLFCMVGIMDPAEKQVIKKKYIEEDVQFVSDRLKVFSMFDEIIRCHHSHSECLEKRKHHLVSEASRRSGLVAMRSLDKTSNSRLLPTLTNMALMVSSLTSP